MIGYYNRLWKQLFDKGWKRKDLGANVQTSHHAKTRFGKEQYVTLESMERICIALGYDVGDVMEFSSKENKKGSDK